MIGLILKIRFKPVFDDCIADGVDNESGDANVVVIIGAIRREKKVTKKFNADNLYEKNNKIPELEDVFEGGENTEAFKNIKVLVVISWHRKKIKSILLAVAKTTKTTAIITTIMIRVKIAKRIINFFLVQYGLATFFDS